MKFDYDKIPQLPRSHWEVDLEWRDIEDHLDRWDRQYILNLNPDYQRAHVWARDQQVAYVEYQLMGGEVSKNITWNCPGWGHRERGPIELLDGKQRLEAVRSFMRGEFPVFGMDYKPGDRIRWTTGFKFRMCSLDTRQEVLRFYLNINTGGTPHSSSDIEHVRKMLAAIEEA